MLYFLRPDGKYWGYGKLLPAGWVIMEISGQP